MAILTLSDPESTSRRVMRELEDIPENPVYVVDNIDHVRDVPAALFTPAPLFAPAPVLSSRKMIDRDMARLLAKQTSTTLQELPRTPNYSRPIQQMDTSCLNWGRFTNTCERIDEEPKTTGQLGTFSDAEMSMFDPIFQDFVKKCYEYGVPGYGGAVKVQSLAEELEAAGEARSHDDSFGGDHIELLNFTVMRKPLPQSALRHDSPQDPYWDMEAWKKWSLGVAGDAPPPAPAIASPPATPPVPLRNPFREFNFSKTRPSRAPFEDVVEAIDEAVQESREWWLSDVFLDNTEVHEVSAKHFPPQVRQQATYKHSISAEVVRASQLSQDFTILEDPDAAQSDCHFPAPPGQRFPGLRSSILVYAGQNKVPRRGYPSSESSSDVSIKFSPLPDALRTAVREMRDEEVEDESLGASAVKTPSKWFVKRLQSLKGGRKK